MAEESASATGVLGSQPAAAADDVLLDVRGLAKAFGPTQALRDCSLQLRAGEVHALMGENGSGKSTLVKIFSGVHRPDAGSITIGGQQLAHLSSPRDSAALGYRHGVPGDPGGRTAVGAGEHLDGQRRVLRRRLSSAERQSRGRETGTLITVDDLDQSADRLTLSDRQAVCIARVLVRAPRILILDGGDVGARRRDARQPVHHPARSVQQRESGSSSSRIAWTRSRSSPIVSRCCARARRWRHSIAARPRRASWSP